MSYRDLKWSFLKVETCVDFCFQWIIPPPNWVGQEEGVGVLYVITLSSSISIPLIYLLVWMGICDVTYYSVHNWDKSTDRGGQIHFFRYAIT